MKFIDKFKRIRATSANYPLSPKPPTKIQITIWGVLVVLTLSLSLIKFNTFQLGTYIDDANYVILAKSFVSSHYYGLINEPIQDKQAQFPFGFPLLLSVSELIFPGNLEVMKFFSLVATLINLSILFWGWRLLSHMDSYWMGVAVSGLYGLFPLVIQHSTMVMSEAVFLMFTLLALLLTERAARGEEKRWWSVVMAVVLFFVLFTRTIGVVFIISIFAYLLFLRGLHFGKQLVFTTACLIILIGVIIWASPLTSSDLLPAEYFHTRSANIITKLSSIISPVLKPNGLSDAGVSDPLSANVDPTIQITSTANQDSLNVRTLLLGIEYHFSSDLRKIILPIGEGKDLQIANIFSTRDFLSIFGWLITILIFLGGFTLLARNKLSIFILSAFLYLAAIMLWVWDGPRLLYPILPQMQFCFIMGMGWLFSIIASTIHMPNVNQKSNLFLIALVIFLGSVSIYKSLRIDDSQLHAGDVQSRTDWLKVNTNKTASIMTEYPEVDYIYSSRKTIQYPALNQITSSDALEGYLVTNHVNYVLVAPQIIWSPVYSPRYSERVNSILPFIEDLTRKNELTMVYASKQNRIKVYKRPN
jgi:Dolichyl-phosphate-mannose-protein mannosyltransferase